MGLNTDNQIQKRRAVKSYGFTFINRRNVQLTKPTRQGVQRRSHITFPVDITANTDINRNLISHYRALLSWQTFQCRHPQTGLRAWLPACAASAEASQHRTPAAELPPEPPHRAQAALA